MNVREGVMKTCDRAQYYISYIVIQVAIDKARTLEESCEELVVGQPLGSIGVDDVHLDDGGTLGEISGDDDLRFNM